MHALAHRVDSAAEMSD